MATRQSSGGHPDWNLHRDRSIMEDSTFSAGGGRITTKRLAQVSRDLLIDRLDQLGVQRWLANQQTLKKIHGNKTNFTDNKIKSSKILRNDNNKHFNFHVCIYITGYI